MGGEGRNIDAHADVQTHIIFAFKILDYVTKNIDFSLTPNEPHNY